MVSSCAMQLLLSLLQFESCKAESLLSSQRSLGGRTDLIVNVSWDKFVDWVVRFDSVFDDTSNVSSLLIVMLSRLRFFRRGAEWASGGELVMIRAAIFWIVSILLVWVRAALWNTVEQYSMFALISVMYSNLHRFCGRTLAALRRMVSSPLHLSRMLLMW